MDKRDEVRSFRIGNDTYVVHDNQMKLEHAVHLKNTSSVDGEAGAFIGCSEMSFIIALYDDNRKVASELVDSRVSFWKSSEHVGSYEEMPRWAGACRMGNNVELNFDIYSMLFVTTFHPEYVYDL